MPLDLNFEDHLKTITIREEYPDLYEHVVMRIVFGLWRQGRLCYQDGIIKKTGRQIERLVGWKGEQGKFIEIVTHEDTLFLDKIDDKEYHIHNWYKRNPQFNKERPDNMVKRNVVKAHKMHEGRERAMLDSKGLMNGDLVVDDCPWLDFKGSYGRLRVVFDKVPKQMTLGDEYFHTRAEFREVNKNATPTQRNARITKIKKHTKRCKKCNKIFVDSSSGKCSSCQGGKK
jgi:hypothetical protein